MEQLLPAYLGIWNVAESLKFLSYSLRPYEENIVRGWLQDHISFGVRYFAATDDQNSVLGICVIRTDALGAFEILGLGVRPDAKGHGLGRELLSHALTLARSEGVTCVEASVFADNARMLRLVLSLDFVPVRIDYHRRADGADSVVLHHRIYDR